MDDFHTVAITSVIFDNQFQFSILLPLRINNMPAMIIIAILNLEWFAKIAPHLSANFFILHPTGLFLQVTGSFIIPINLEFECKRIQLALKSAYFVF